MFSRLKDLIVFPKPGKKNTGSDEEKRELSAQFSPLDESENLKKKGDEYLIKGDLSTAEEYYINAIALNPDNAKAHSNLGFVLKEKNLNEEAEKALRRALLIDPKIADAQYILGVIFQQKGEWGNAIEYFERALELDPGFAFCARDLCFVFFQNGQIENAKQVAIKGISLNPTFADLYFYLGNIYGHTKEFENAITFYRKALSIQPDYVEVHYNLGRVYQDQDNLNEAIVCYKTVLSLQNNYIDAHNNLGMVYQTQGKLDEALICYKNALACNQDYPSAHNNLGLIFEKKNKLEDALASYRRALSLNPEYAEAYYNMGIVFQRLGNIQEALDSYEKAFSIKPDFAEARLASIFTKIPSIRDSKDQIDVIRKTISQEIAEFSNWCEKNKIDGEKIVGSNQPFFLSYQEENNRDLFSQYGALCSRLMKVWQDRQNFSFQNKVPSGPIRVGIVSADIQNHSVWHAIIKGWLQYLDQTRFEIYGFYIGLNPDEHTAWAASRSTYFEGGAKSLLQWVESISMRQLDVIIYPAIGMDPLTVKLASMRLAPVQIAAWGHPDTSGLPTVDYYLSAECFEPTDAQDNYSEQLVALPNLGCSYQALPVIPSDPDIKRLGINVAASILLCPGSHMKYDPQYDWMFVEIAQRLGKCNIVFFDSNHIDLANKLHSRIEHAFAQSHLNMNDFCKFIPWQKRSAFYGLMKQADVFLDTIGFSGFNTAMQAIECGLPVVTRDGRYMRGRLASGILRRIGLPELIVNTEKEYIDLVIKLVKNKEYQKRLRQQIEKSRSVLFDDVASVRALENFLIKVVKRENNVKP